MSKSWAGENAKYNIKPIKRIKNTKIAIKAEVFMNILKIRNLNKFLKNNKN